MIFAKVDAQEQDALRSEMQTTKNAKWYRRLKVIDLSAQGYNVPDLADMFDICAGTIRRYIHAYNEAGLAGLQADYGQGRPLTVTWTKEQWLDLLAQSPADLPLLETADQNWTQAMLRRYLARLAGRGRRCPCTDGRSQPGRILCPGLRWFPGFCRRSAPGTPAWPVHAECGTGGRGCHGGDHRPR